MGSAGSKMIQEDMNDTGQPKEYLWYVVSVIKNRQSIVQFLNSKEPTGEVARVYFPIEVGDTITKPLMGYIFVKCIPGYLDAIQFMYEKSYRVVGNISEEDVIKMEEKFASRDVSSGSSIVPGVRVEFIEGNYVGFKGNVEEVNPNGEITVKVWFMETVTRVYDHIKNVRIYNEKGDR